MRLVLFIPRVVVYVIGLGVLSHVCLVSMATRHPDALFDEDSSCWWLVVGYAVLTSIAGTLWYLAFFGVRALLV